MPESMKNFLSFFFGVMVLVLVSFPPALADEVEFNRLEASFKNFLTCELTRTGATNFFDKKPFKITMIDLFDIRTESDITIITGAVECLVVDKSRTLYAALGLKSILGKEEVAYFTIRHEDFSILATQLIRFPYKERCKFTQYRIDLD